jgi:hypothetical protein
MHSDIEECGKSGTKCARRCAASPSGVDRGLREVRSGESKGRVGPISRGISFRRGCPGPSPLGTEEVAKQPPNTHLSQVETRFAGLNETPRPERKKWKSFNSSSASQISASSPLTGPGRSDVYTSQNLVCAGTLNRAALFSSYSNGRFEYSFYSGGTPVSSCDRTRRTMMVSSSKRSLLP